MIHVSSTLWGVCYVYPYRFSWQTRTANRRCVSPSKRHCKRNEHETGKTFPRKLFPRTIFEFVEKCFVQIFEIKMNMCIQIKMYRDVLSLNPDPDIGNDKKTKRILIWYFIDNIKVNIHQNKNIQLKVKGIMVFIRVVLQDLKGGRKKNVNTDWWMPFFI